MIDSTAKNRHVNKGKHGKINCDLDEKNPWREITNDEYSSFYAAANYTEFFTLLPIFDSLS